MTNTSSIRLLLVSPLRRRREAVRTCVEAHANFRVFEAAGVDRLAEAVQDSGAQVVLLIQPEMHELLSEYLAVSDGPWRVPVIAIGRKGSKSVSDRMTLGGVAAYLPVQDLGRLSQVVSQVLTRAPLKGGHGVKLSTDSLRESQKLISIGRLTAEIVHEINNPLESVGNLLYLAQLEPGLPEQTVDYLRSAERELARVVQISKQTLSFHRESSQPTSILMSDLMEEVVDLYSRRISGKHLDLVREYTSVAGLNALPGEIRQVLSNLVTNAIEASGTGGKLRLRVRSSHRMQGEVRVPGLRISVADTGSGIPQEVRKRLGELFFTTKGQSGTGLGLWVTRSIVQRYGGTMCLKSSTGLRHGTVFHVFLPFESALHHQPMKVVNGANEVLEARRGTVRQISDHPRHSDNRVGSRNRFSAAETGELPGKRHG